MYIQYLIAFQDDLTQVVKALDLMLALRDIGNKVNVIYLVFVEMFGLVVYSNNINVKKIDDTTLEIYRIVLMAFLVIDQANKVRLFVEAFLGTNLNSDVVLRIPFFTLSGYRCQYYKKRASIKIFYH